MSDIPFEKTKPNAKEKTLLAQIIAFMWITIGTILIGIGFFRLTVWDIVISGLAMAGVFAPVYISVILDKIKDIKNGKSV